MNRRPTSALVILALVFWGVAACDSDPEPTPEASGQTPGEGSDPDPATFYACEEDRFGVGKPLASPAFDPDSGGLVGETQDSYVVHTTELYVRPDKMERFGELVEAIFAQLGETEGLVAFSLAGGETCGAQRTLAIWASEEAMYKFVASGAHATAMASTQDISYTGRVTHWTATADEVNALTWETAMARIAEVPASPLYD